jgi:FAD/FMN-containing dehydrogenase/Fe-S oxidoreductase
MTSAQQQAALVGTGCEVAFDQLTRRLYATDASIYQVEPVAVGFPKGARQASLLVEAAAQAGIPVIPRGAGTGLAGGAIGEGLVIDFARYNRSISELDVERRTVRVDPGVVLDQLNAALRPAGFRFGPDVATSSRATLGGMIANNSSGSHTPFYGTTADHVRALDIVLADGRVVTIGPAHDTLRKERDFVRDLVYFNALVIEEKFPPGLLKRRPGYALDRSAREPDNLNHLWCGSEGTLGGILSAELKIVPLPERKEVVLIFFASVEEAMQATQELLNLRPAAIEHLDRVLLDQTRGQLEFRAAREMLALDDQPCESLLAVEFFDGDAEEQVRAVAARGFGLRTRILMTPSEAALLWGLRKAGLSLLTGCKGSAKPTTGIEDTAVAPKDLADYVKALQRLMHGAGLQASYYGHAASGLLHVRPVLDLHSPADVRKFRALAEDVSALVSQFKGSLAAEHGVGIARTEFMLQQVGEEMLGLMRQVKAAFDPFAVFNPGKIVPDGRYLFDADLRMAPGRELTLPFSPVLAFADKDEDFLLNLEQCNGCGGCRKDTPSMCPTFPVTEDEQLTTRGRANLIRAVLEPGYEGDVLRSPELEAALGSCLGCRACVTECPSNVNLPLLKAELLNARMRQHGRSVRERLIGAVDLLGRVGCVFPRLANKVTGSIFFRSFLSKTLGLAWQRLLPSYTQQRFDRWFAKQPLPQAAPRGRIILWDDTFVRYHEPQIGIAAVQVLTAAGYQVELVQGRKCCGRPAFSQGDLDTVSQLGRHNLQLLNADPDPVPIVFLEPSCYSMFVQDYRELRLDGWESVAARCVLFERFVETLLAAEPEALAWNDEPARMVIHGHCHVKALMHPAFLAGLARRLPNREVTLLDTGCCGMAGAFGAMQDKYELSLKVAEPLARKIREQPFGTIVVASGTSCRQQIGHLAPVRPRHMAEVLADALAPNGSE